MPAASSVGWFGCRREASVPGAVATNQFKIRFVTGETGATGSIVEAAVDAVKLDVISCTPPSCPADFDGNGGHRTGNGGRYVHGGFVGFEGNQGVV